MRIFVTGGGGWRDLPDWPPPSTRTTLSPHPGSVLGGAPSAATEPLRFVFDPADPTPTIGGRLLMAVAAGYRDDGALAERADMLSFTGPELCADLQIIGVPYVELAHAVDTPSADVAVRISDVDPNGRSCNISDGYVRIGRDSSSPLRIELDPIAHRFRVGHRIRLLIAGGSFPRFARNLGTGEPLATGAEFVRSTHVLDCAGPRLGASARVTRARQRRRASRRARLLRLAFRRGRYCYLECFDSSELVAPSPFEPSSAFVADALASSARCLPV